VDAELVNLGMIHDLVIGNGGTISGDRPDVP
jgi:hypothetical protein